MGGFALGRIRKGTPLIEYVGERITKAEAAVRCEAIPEHLEKLEHYCREHEFMVFPVSSATGKGIDTLVGFLSGKVEEGRKQRGKSAPVALSNVNEEHL